MSGIIQRLQIEPVPAYRDNYIWLLHAKENPWAVVVDPGDAVVVSRYLRDRQLRLAAILITHHHSDHTGGIAGLLKQFPDTAVYGPLHEDIQGVCYKLNEGDSVTLDVLDLDLQVMDVPGHTAGHIAYYLADNEAPAVFCGDTLFSAGCGRLFEGTARQLHDSLHKLSSLPANTRVYCAHEYTLNNIDFALHVTPDAPALLQYAAEVKLLRDRGLPSLPVRVGSEREYNPFLRLDDVKLKHAVENHAGKILADSVEVFAALRKWKDGF